MKDGTGLALVLDRNAHWDALNADEFLIGIQCGSNEGRLLFAPNGVDVDPGALFPDQIIRCFG